MQTWTRDAEGIQHLLSMLISKYWAKRGRAERNRHSQVTVGFIDLDVTDARLSSLAQRGALLSRNFREYVLGSDRGVAHERHFVLRREKTDMHVVIASFRREYERGLTIQLTRNRLHLIV